MMNHNALGNAGHSRKLSVDEINDEDSTRSTFAKFQAREEEIERKKMEVKEKVEMRLGQAEQETRRLAEIWEELEVLSDPYRKEVAIIRKKIDLVDREVKSLGQSFQRKEKEYKEALDGFNEKSKEKAQLMNTLTELMSESESLRMKKLEELSKNINSALR